MDQKALDKAKRRLRVASASAKGMQDAKIYEEFADQWYMFLHAAKGIYTTLEQGTKAIAQERHWFGRKNQERKDDPLLRYISEARNDDEHGIEESTKIAPSVLKVGVAAPGASAVMRDQFGITVFLSPSAGAAFAFGGAHPNSKNLPQITALDGKPIRVEFTPERIVLKPVHDRNRKRYDPPKTHLGNPLSTDSPQEVARLAIDYLSGLITEAEGFCKP